MSSFDYAYWNAVGRGYTDTVARSVTAHPYYANATDEHGWTPLLIAASVQRIQVIKVLLENGADVNKRGPHDWTALYIAISRGHYHVCEILLNAGANIYNIDLPEASRNGDTDICELLLSRGALIDGTSLNGDTALHRASCCGNVDTLRMLLDRGASTGIMNADRQIPEEVAGQCIKHKARAVQKVPVNSIRQSTLSCLTELPHLINQEMKWFRRRMIALLAFGHSEPVKGEKPNILRRLPADVVRYLTVSFIG